MTPTPRTSSSPDAPDFEYHEPQQRRSSLGDYDPSTAPPATPTTSTRNSLRPSAPEMDERGRVVAGPGSEPTPSEERTDLLMPTLEEEEDGEILGRGNGGDLMPGE
ncbi:hypothetical protein CJF32_00007285 [Rutstroemia sp. NJR-2017a WRK4]|nr:hypothetical protein CJF32_00007285 [Rutstroemia sp. NJR-2017a WRK4]